MNLVHPMGHCLSRRKATNLKVINLRPKKAEKKANSNLDKCRKTLILVEVILTLIALRFLNKMDNLTHFQERVLLTMSKLLNKMQLKRKSLIRVEKRKSRIQI
jgi:hypothetical protein